MLTKTIAVACYLLPAVFLVATATAQRPGGRNSEHPSAPPRAPSLFGPHVISTEDDEFGITFSPDGKTCFFTKRTPSTISSSTYVICSSHLVNGKWTDPAIASFSGKYKDFNPFISPDGSKLFFISNRPGPGKTTPDGDIWMAPQKGEGWGEPENIGAPVNTPGWELSCAVTANGSIYFISLNTTTGKQGLYCSRQMDGKYSTPEYIGDSVNNFDDASDVYVTPDEKFLLFSSKFRSDVLTSGNGASASYPRSDLYISFKENGKWTTPKNAGNPINSTAEETNPSVSPDGKTLFFTSQRNFISIPMQPRLTYASLETHLHDAGNGLGDIYEVSFADLLAKAAKLPAPAIAGDVPTVNDQTGIADGPTASGPNPSGSWPAPSAGTDTPSNHPGIFGEGVISTRDDEFGGTFTPDGKTCFFSKSVLKFYLDVICFSQYKDGRWQQPQVAPFSGIYRDFDPVLSPDGTKMIFTSSRPVTGIAEADYNIWMVKKTATGWSEPILLDTTINSKYNEHFASIAANGNIYFSSDRPGAIGGEGDADIYRSRFVDGKYMPAEHLDSVSSAAYELDCLIAPDESFILTGCYNRSGGYGNYDIYYSLNKNGAWTGAKNLGPKVNSRFRDYSPRISPDGKYLFYTSEKDFSAVEGQISDYLTLEKNLHSVLNGSGNIYCIEIKDLDLK
jgi:Tol biopolymer transport system component